MIYSQAWSEVVKNSLAQRLTNTLILRIISKPISFWYSLSAITYLICSNHGLSQDAVTRNAKREMRQIQGVLVPTRFPSVCQPEICVTICAAAAAYFQSSFLSRLKSINYIHLSAEYKLSILPLRKILTINCKKT